MVAITNSTNSTGCSKAGGGDFDQISFVIAISLAILAALSNNLGVNFQKLAWTKKQNNGSKRLYRSLWLGGMLGIILASVFDFAALAFGPQSVIAPLGALTMVINACVAPMMHGEKLPKVVYKATFIIVSGCAMAVATAAHANVICDLNSIFGFFLTPQTIVYAIVSFFFCLGWYTLIRRCERILREYKADSEEYLKVFKFHRISYALLAGFLGAQSVVFARAIGQLLQSSARGGELFLVRPETYGIILGLILMIYLQLYFLNKGLEKFESSYNVPVFTGTFIVGTAVSGGIVYQEFDTFSPLQAALFPLGVIMCIFGVALLARGGNVPTDDDSVESPAPRDNIQSIVVISDFEKADGASPQDSENPEFIKAHLEQPIAPRVSSLRIRSGGFIPFVVEETRQRAASSLASDHRRARADTNTHNNWLLGFKIDEEDGYVREGSTPSY